MHIQTQRFYERHTGDAHDVTVMFDVTSNGSKSYRVNVDSEFYSNHSNKAQAFDEIADIIKINNWAPVRPF